MIYTITISATFSVGLCIFCKKPSCGFFNNFYLLKSISISLKRNSKCEGIYTCGCSIPTGASDHFFLLLETPEKLTKIDFSSVAEKKEHVPEKYLSMIISDAHRINFFPFLGMDICSRLGAVNSL